MREIPSLQTLCLRNVGGKACSGEDAFAENKKGSGNDKESSLSSASELLRSFPGCPVPISRIPAIGIGSARREQANDVDLNHPFVAVLLRKQGEEAEKENTMTVTKAKAKAKASTVLYAEHSTPALDLLQSYIDSLVELGRFDDARLGLHFFQEWKANVICKDAGWAAQYEAATAAAAVPPPATKKRRRTSSASATAASTTTGPSLIDPAAPPPLGSLSLYNTIIQDETIQAMVESNMTYHLSVLDWTGVQTLTDDYFQDIVSRAPHLQRLSVKNCRRLTQVSLECLSEHATQLTALDVGGAYNLHAQHVLETVAALPHLTELHASGLLWTDALLADLSSLRSWKALSLGFLIPGHVSSNGLKQALISQTSSLTSLALPFCEHIVDAALLGVLGRHLPLVRCLDVRGNGQLNSLTGWYDGRATITTSSQQQSVGPQPLFVLARYSGISKSNIEDTKRIHPLQAVELTCAMESDGVGKGIQRFEYQD
jgi:hypothetical protein